MAAKIYDTDSPLIVASKIFKHFDIGENITVNGYVRNEKSLEIEEVGIIIIKELERLDKYENCGSMDKGGKRKHKYLSRSVGGPVAQKIFQWDRKKVDGVPRYFIWRAQ